MKLPCAHQVAYITCQAFFINLFCSVIQLSTSWVIFFGLLPNLSYAAETGPQVSSAYTIKHFTDENGLPQNSIKSIAQAADGYIWLATENGLVRFDGSRFYTFDKSNVKIESNRISAFRKSINPLGVTLYAEVNPYNDASFTIQDGSVKAGQNKDNQRLKSLFPQTSYNSIYVTNGLPSYFGDTYFTYVYLIPHRNGDFFACYDSKIEYFNNWKKTRTQKVCFNNQWDLIKLGHYLFLSSYDGTFTRIGSIKNTDQEIKNLSVQGDITANPAYARGQKNFKIYWNAISDDVFLYLNKSLYLLRDGGSVLSTKLILQDFDFEANFIATVHYDQKHDRVFLGSATKGLFVINHNNFRALTINSNPQDNVFYGQLPFSDTTVLVRMNRVLGLKARSDGVVSYTVNKEFENHSLANNSQFRDKDGFIWLKSFFKVVKYDREGKIRLGQWDFADNQWITRLYEGRNGRIWIGTDTSGIYNINQRDGTIQRLFPNSLKSITYLHQETDDVLWVGTEKGLYRVHISKRRIEPIKGLQGIHIRSLHFSSPGQIWITTYENGFFLYQNGGLIHYPTDKNKYLLASHSITEDRNGFFWITTNKGLFQISKKDLLDYAVNRKQTGIFYLYYDKSQGFNTNEFNGGCQPCAVRLANGYVSLPSLEGVVWFKPEKVTPELPDAKLKLDRVEIGDKVISSNTAAIQLPFQALQVKLHFSTPYFGHRENLHLFYSLSEEGSSEIVKWFPLNNEDMIVHLSNLSSGAHTVTVRKAKGFGLNNYDYIKVKLEVSFPWYDRWWIKLLAMLFLVTLLYLYFRRRITSVERKNVLMEVKVAERTQKLEQAMALSKQSQEEVNHQMYIQSRIIASITHDFRTPMNSIIYSSGKIEEMVEASQYSHIGEVGASIKDTSTRIKVLLDNLLEYIRPQVHHKSFQKSDVILSELISVKFELLAISKRAHPNTFISEVPLGLTVSTNYDLIGIVVHNLIDNANKFTYKGIVKVSAETSENSLTLTISDTGPGMQTKMTDWLNSANGDVPQNSGHSKENGMGLIIVKEVARLLGIQLKATSGANGSAFHLIFDTTVTSPDLL